MTTPLMKLIRASVRKNLQRASCALSHHILRVAFHHPWYNLFLIYNSTTGYSLAEPKANVKEEYISNVQNLLMYSEAGVELIKAYKKQHGLKRMPRAMTKFVYRPAAKRLVNKFLRLCRQCAGALLKSIRMVQSLCITCKEDFGEGCHTASTEPYYYDPAYQLIDRHPVLPVDDNGRWCGGYSDKPTKRALAMGLL